MTLISMQEDLANRYEDASFSHSTSFSFCCPKAKANSFSLVWDLIQDGRLVQFQFIMNKKAVVGMLWLAGSVVVTATK